jgi:predicted ATPase
MLDDRFRLYKLGSHGTPLRQQSLRATLDWSYGLLSARQAALLRAVCVFAADFSVDGAAAVSNADHAEVMDTLAQLAAKSLLAMDTAADAVVCRLPETTRFYGLERLRAAGEVEAVRLRHAAYVGSVLERAASERAQRPRLHGVRATGFPRRRSTSLAG